MAPIIDESLNTSLQSWTVLPSKDIYEEPFGYHSGNCSPIIVAKMDVDVVQGIYPASSLILDTQGRVLEPYTEYENPLFGWQCGILVYENYDRVQYSSSISTLKLLRLYGIITQHGEINPELLFSMDITLDALLTHSLPYEFRITIIYTSTLRSHILNDFISICDGKMSTSQCFHI